MRPAVVDLRDLASRYAWEPRAITRFPEASERVAEGLVRQAFAPPAVLIVIAPCADVVLVERACAWLADAAHVIVLRDWHDDRGAWADAALRAVVDDEWRPVLARVAPVQVFDWCDDPAPCHAALALARSLAASVGERAVAPPAYEQPELLTSAWIPCTVEPRAHRLALELVARFEPAGRLRVSGDEVVELAAPPAALRSHPIDDLATRALRRHHPGWIALGGDPLHPVAWRGDRMFVYWSYVGRALGFLSASDHDFPCGPAKKLYGYDNNDPVQVCLAPDASLVAARFDHDVLVTTAVPITSPRQARHCLSYVLNNWRRHREDWRTPVARRVPVDPYSSAPLFDGWREVTPADARASLARDYEPLPIARATTWLLTTGWRRHPAIGVRERPGPFDA